MHITSAIATLRLIGILLLCVPVLVAGAERSTPTKRIVAVVTAYANTVGCFIHMDSRNIVPYKIEGKEVFVALYSIDGECSGGNTMHRPAFAVLQSGDRGRVFVLPQYSIPSATSQNFPQFIERIFVRDKQLWYSAKEFNWGVAKPGDPGDALCCPSLPVEGHIVFQNGAWLDSRNP